MNLYKPLVKPFLFRMSADQAHDWTIHTSSVLSNWTLATYLLRRVYGYEDPALRQQIHGLTFPNPIGLAAGFDKNGLTVPLMQALGFGFVEIGSITARNHRQAIRSHGVFGCPTTVLSSIGWG